MSGDAKAMVLVAPRELEAQRFPLPEIRPLEGLLQVEACGLCGTDHEQWTGTLPAGFAFVPGHESVGTIDAVGPRAAERWGVAVGDRVAVEVFQSCGECEPCLSGAFRRCRRHGLRDMYGDGVHGRQGAGRVRGQRGPATRPRRRGGGVRSLAAAGG